MSKSGYSGPSANAHESTEPGLRRHRQNIVCGVICIRTEYWELARHKKKKHTQKNPHHICCLKPKKYFTFCPFFMVNYFSYVPCEGRVSVQPCSQKNPTSTQYLSRTYHEINRQFILTSHLKEGWTKQLISRKKQILSLSLPGAVLVYVLAVELSL